MQRVSKAFSLVREMSRLYALATDMREKVGVARFAAKTIVSYCAPQLMREDREDTVLSLQQTTYVVGLNSGEAGTFEELFYERVYDQIEDFVPQAGWTVFDVGANAGFFACLQAKRGARVFAFEPNPAAYRRLSKAVVSNKLTGVVNTFNYAVSSKPGAGTMLMPTTLILGAVIPVTILGTIVPDTTAGSPHTFPVKLTSLDSIVPALGLTCIDLLKIDTEGAEVEVLQGAERSLRLVERVIIEYHSQELKRQVGDLLGKHQFSQVLHVGSGRDDNAGLLYAKRLRETKSCSTV